MVRRLPFRNLWRVVREIDLEAVRRGATSRFQILIAGDTLADAEQLRTLIGPHPWLVTADASGAPLEEHFDLVVLVSRTADLSPALSVLRDQAASHAPVVVVVVGAEESAAATAAIARRRESERVAVPDLETRSLEPIGKALLTAVPPDLRLALGRQLHGLRSMVFDNIIDETARANAAYAFTTGIAEIVPVLSVPMNIGDIVVLTKNQLVMSYKIALVAGKTGSPRKLIGEIVGVLGGGLLFRQIARQLVGLVPIAGIVSKVAVAYAGTWSIGQAVILWAEFGEAVTAASARAYYEEGLARGREAARTLVSRRRGA